MIDCGESDQMIKISGKMNKSRIYKGLVVVIFHSFLFQELLQTIFFFFFFFLKFFYIFYIYLPLYFSSYSPLIFRPSPAPILYLYFLRF